MNRLSQQEQERLMELLADEQFDQLGPEDRSELDVLRERASSTPDLSTLVGELAVAMDDAAQEQDDLPAPLREVLLQRGRGIVAPGGRPAIAGAVGPSSPPARSGLGWLAAAAAVAILALGGLAAYLAVEADDRAAALAEAEARARAAEASIQERAEALARAREQLEKDRLQREKNLALIAELRTRAESQTSRITQLERDNLDYAEDLARAEQDLARAELRIALFEAPDLPERLRENRELLAKVPGTVRRDWQPFDLPNAPAEQPGVSGYVLWNDREDRGYLTFRGLKVNDPEEEVYQAWIIDDRGNEQKVSGGIFNATEDGEVIVPIDPSVPVERVSLFAVTIEGPRGVAVPSLERRVVAAPNPAPAEDAGGDD